MTAKPTTTERGSDEGNSFDLLEKPWIPVTDHGGRVQELSIRAVLGRAAEFAALGGELPTQEFAILRLLLAILHRSIAHRVTEPRRTWQELWNEWPTEDIERYLDSHRDRFDLLHPQTPFFQVPGLRSGKDAVSSLDKVIADVPNGAKYFTTRAGESIERIGFAEAARWLVHVHAFDPSGIKTGADGDPRVKGGRGYPIGVAWSGCLGGVYLEGGDLRRTLLLNLVLADLNGAPFAHDDAPPWEREPLGPRVRERVRPGGTKPVADPNPCGPVDLYTWQSRRVRLVASGGAVTGVVLCNGDPLEPFNKHLLEPMTAWRYSEIQSKKAGESRHYPLLHDPDKSLWRGLRSLLGDVASTTPLSGRAIAPGVVEWAVKLIAHQALPADEPVRLHAVGMQYINNQSVVGEIVDDAIGFPAAVMSPDPQLRTCAVNAVQVAEAAVDALGSLAADLAAAAGGETEGVRARVREEGFFALEAPYRRWLRELDPLDFDFDAEATEWERTVHRIVRRLGEELVSTAGRPAWVGRSVREQWLDSSIADTRFHQRLRRCLPSAFQTRTATSEQEETANDELVPVAF